MNLSTKEVNYLKDHLSWELMAAKKCYNHAQDATDQQYSKLLDDIGRVHQENFVDILNYVNQKAKEV
ncbi:MAG: hypothetical protein SCK29_03780 [Bacillota bacterium]|nr:hypothetical protein [Bacillota bacterium]MDW7683226.1 hypothetical protein [Bacillota bacterium]